MKRALFTVLATMAIAGPVFAQAPSTNVAGDWDVTVVSPQGPNTTRLSLTQDADKLTGKFKSQAGDLPVTGTVSGADVKILFTVSLQGQSLDITLSGKVTDATIAGTAVFGTFGEGEFTAKRADSTAAAAPPAPAAPATTSAPATTTETTTASAIAAGKWDVTFKTPQGDMPGTATLTDEGGKLTGTFGSQMGEAPVTGTVSGKSLKLKLQAQTPQGEMQVDMTGDIDGDAIVNGKAEVMGMQLEWTAKRIKQ